MGRALASGFAGAVRRWPIVLLLWVVGVVFGLSFSLVAGKWLALSLNSALASRTLIKNIDANVFVDLFLHHHESLSMFLLVGLVMIVVGLVFSIGLNAGVAGTALDPSSRVELTEFWRTGLRLYPVFTRLWLLAMLVLAAVLAVLAGGGFLLARWLSESANETPYSYTFAGLGLFAAVLVMLLAAVHDHARLYAARTDRGAIRAYAWALWFVFVGDLRAPLLALVLFLIGVLFWVVYQGVVVFLPVTTGGWVTISLLWGQVLMQGRALVRVVAFVSQADLQQEMPE